MFTSIIKMPSSGNSMAHEESFETQSKTNHRSNFITKKNIVLVVMFICGIQENINERNIFL